MIALREGDDDVVCQCQPAGRSLSLRHGASGQAIVAGSHAVRAPVGAVHGPSSEALVDAQTRALGRIDVEAQDLDDHKLAAGATSDVANPSPSGGL